VTDIVTRLDELLEKSKRQSKLGMKDSKEAASLLYDLYNNDEPIAKVADYLAKLAKSVSPLFFGYTAESMDAEKVKALCGAIRSSEAYRISTIDTKAFRGFVFTAHLLEHSHDLARIVLANTLPDVDGSRGFSKATIKTFNSEVVSKFGIEAIEKLGELEWESASSKYLFDSFMKKVRSTDPPPASDSQPKSIKPKAPKPETIKSETIKPEPPQTDAPPLTTQPKESTTSAIAVNDSAALLMTELMKKLEETNAAMGKLTVSMNERSGRNDPTPPENERINHIPPMIEREDLPLQTPPAAPPTEQANAEIRNLQAKLDAAKAEHSKQQRVIENLNEQLKVVMKHDGISQNQALIALRTGLENSLKPEYSYYLSDKDDEYNPDTFDSFRGSLSRIFRALKRFNIIED